MQIPTQPDRRPDQAGGRFSFVEVSAVRQNQQLKGIID